MRRALSLVAHLLLAAPLFAAGGNKSVPKLGNLSGAPLIPAIGASIPSLPSVVVPQLPSALTNLQPQQVPVLPSAVAPTAPVQLSVPNPQPQQPQEGERLIDSLSANIPLLADENAGGEEQSSHAEAAFTRKAGGKSASRNKADPPPAKTPPPPAQPPAPPSGDDGGGPNHPKNVVKFRGGEYPSVAFRPNTPVEPLLIQAIDSAKKTLHIAIYEFKLPGVLEALRRARDRGVKIDIVLDFHSAYPAQAEEGEDYQPRRSKEIWALLREGFEVKVLRGLGQYGIMHNKFVVVDAGERESLGEYGSYNWAWSAESQHYENVLFTTEKKRLKAMKAYWDYLDGLAQTVYNPIPPGSPYKKRPVKNVEEFSWPNTVPAPPAPSLGTVNFNGIELPMLVATPTADKNGQTFEDHMVEAINHVEKSLDISIFALRSTRIAEAVVALHKAGKKVRVIIDEGQSVSEAFDEYAQHLAFHGVPVKVLAGPDPNSPYPYAQKNHNKLAIFDGKMVETGSANYTKYAAIANFENANFIDDATTVAAFTFYFDHMWGQAKVFAAPAQAPRLASDSELEQETRRPPNPRQPRKPHPGPPPGVEARKLDFHGQEFPSYAFRPDTPVEPLLAKAVDAAQKSVRLALYEFNLEAVMDALRRAKKRGLTVELVIDKKHVYTSGVDHTGNARMPSPQIQALIAEGFDVLILNGEKGGIMHNKYAVLDAELSGQSMVVFGSYNWAVSAEMNHYENVVFSRDQHKVDDYLAYFKYKRDLAEAVDHDRLDEVLARAEGAGPVNTDDGLDDKDDASEPQAGGFPNPDERTSKRPAPPESTAPMIDINGTQLHQHYFSPEGGIQQAWISAIKAAKTSIDIAMFVWWSKDVADALLEARAANPALKIRILLDAGQGTLAKIDGKSAKDWFLENEFDVKLQDGPNDIYGDPMLEKQHNKMMLIDGKWVFTGSFNLSPTAEKYSFENENVLDDPIDVRGFMEFFERMFRLAWTPKKKASAPQLGPNGKRVAPLGV